MMIAMTISVFGVLHLLTKAIIIDGVVVSYAGGLWDIRQLHGVLLPSACGSVPPCVVIVCTVTGMTDIFFLPRSPLLLETLSRLVACALTASTAVNHLAFLSPDPLDGRLKLCFISPRPS